MGIGPFRNYSSSAYDKKSAPICVDRKIDVTFDNEKFWEKMEKIAEKSGLIKKDVLPNPDPYNWIINRSQKVGNYLIVDVTYPDCVNYEGKKIMVYEGINTKDLRDQKSIDPHFSSNKKFHSPVARFEPTEFGWEIAVKLAKVLTEK